MGQTITRTYSEMIMLPTFEERFRYLQLSGMVGEETFGFDRYLNQKFYSSREWKRFRDNVIVRDDGCDLAMQGYDLFDHIIIHHINPLAKEDILNVSYKVFDLDNVVCVSDRTHKAIHYGTEELLETGPIIRTPNDTCPWRRNE